MKKKIKKIPKAKNSSFFLKSSLKKYKGKYVAILGKKIVASGKNAKEVWEKARKKYPDRLPTIAKLPKGEALILKISGKRRFF